MVDSYQKMKKGQKMQVRNVTMVCGLVVIIEAIALFFAGLEGIRP
jgi:hypothetical protein